MISIDQNDVNLKINAIFYEKLLYHTLKSQVSVEFTIRSTELKEIYYHNN